MNRVMLVWMLSVFVALGAGYGAYEYVTEARRAQEQAKAEEQQRLEAEALAQQVDALMERFVGRLRQDMEGYRKTRNVLKELVTPYNLATPEYVLENQRLMEEAITTARAHGGAIFQLFVDTEKELSGLLENADASLSMVFAEQWKTLKEKEVARYASFFEAEESRFEAYRALMQFYQQRSGTFQIDRDSGTIVFTNADDARTEQALRAALETVNITPPQ